MKAVYQIVILKDGSTGKPLVSLFQTLRLAGLGRQLCNLPLEAERQ